ncbi:MAG: regulatory protein RecX [Nitriliruptoraceae bacterium]
MADHATPYRDAEAWLAERGVVREPIHLAPRPTPEDAPPSASADRGPSSEVAAATGADGASADGAAADGADADGADGASGAEGPRTPGAVVAGADRPSGEVGAREAHRLLGQVGADAALAAAERDAIPATSPGLEDDVARAVAFIRRSTAGAPQAEGRLRDKLTERGHPEQVIRLALERAGRQGLIDDAAMATALVDEKRRAGHAPARIRRDLRGRGFTDEVLDPLLAAVESEDQEAAAFAVAAERAARLTGTATEAAYRRVVGHVTRRGYPQGLARKVARAAVFSSREQERAAGR